MFDFAVRRLRWLAGIPLVPQWFDACLVAWTAVFHRRRLAAMEALEREVGAWPGVERWPHRLGGIGFRRGGREFAHLHGNGLLDIHLGRERAAEAVRMGAARVHHVLGPSAWVSLWLRDESDLPTALGWMREAGDGGEIRASSTGRSGRTPASRG